MPRPRSRVRYQAAPGLAPTRPADARVVPTVDPWTAGEMFVSPHVEERRRGFAILCGSDSARASALTLHLLASRIDEPDLALRMQIAHVLGDYFELRGREFRYPPEVRGAVSGHLRKFDRSQVLALLELHAARRAGSLPARAESLRRLFERIPDASAQLVRIAGDRQLALPLRQAAIESVGLVGFLDARPALEGLKLRLEGRQAGQLTMLFAPSDLPEDAALLPALKDTLYLLDHDE
jgi:hypothetical protein